MIASLVIYDKHGQLAAILDIKKQLGTNRQWATQLRSNLFAHGLWPRTPFFLAIVPDHLYLWKNAPDTPDEIEPDYDLDIWDSIKPYCDRLGVPVEKLDVYTFELLVSGWLCEIDLFGLGSATERLQGLVDSGFFKVLQQGQMAMEADI